MTNVASLAGIAAMIGDPARAAMLVSLMDGRALTAGELAGAAGVTAATASGHLARMRDGGLLSLECQGRHRYYRIASPSVGGLIESLMSVSGELRETASRARPVRTGPRDQALRQARLCYDHLAGEVGVAIADRLVASGQLELGRDGGALTAPGADFLRAIGVRLPAAAPRSTRQATFCRPCMDWSERRFHLAGQLGRALCAALVTQGWIATQPEGRALTITPVGLMGFERHFGLTLCPPRLSRD